MPKRFGPEEKERANRMTICGQFKAECIDSGLFH